MKPTLVQRFFADHWPLRLLMGCSISICVVIVVAAHWPITMLSLSDAAWLVLKILAATLLGYMLTAFPGYLILFPLFQLIARKNGAPFQIGDRVMILTGKHRGRVTSVYELWPSRSQIRLTLSEDDCKAVTDVFDYAQVCRVKPES